MGCEYFDMLPRLYWTFLQENTFPREVCIPEEVKNKTSKEEVDF